MKTKNEILLLSTAIIGITTLYNSIVPSVELYSQVETTKVDDVQKYIEVIYE